MPWWVWLTLGLVLFALEVLGQGAFYLVFFGAGALVVGLLGLAGVPLPLWGEWLLFTAVSLLLVLTLRSRLLGRLSSGNGEIDDSLIGEWAVIAQPLGPGAVGAGELRGARWTVQNTGELPLDQGERCRVERVEGLTLHVRKPVAPSGAS